MDAIIFVILCVVALMSGILSLYREVAGMYFPNAVLGKDLFWSCTRVALAASLVALWVRERKSRKRLENPKESSTSLRKRVRELADELETFYRDRQANAPPFYLNDSQPESSNNKHAYYQQTLDICNITYGSRFRGICQELKAKGVDLQIHPSGVELGDMGQAPGDKEIHILRNLAYRLQYNDEHVRL
jgi:hypothetical protein